MDFAGWLRLSGLSYRIEERCFSQNLAASTSAN
jgi:hypothetical protein